MQVREKVGKSRNTLFFPMICGSGGSKSRLAKAAGAEPSGQMRDEKLHAVVARSTFRSPNVTKHTRFGPLLEVEMSKKRTPLWREAHFEVKMHKTHQGFGPLLEVEMSKKSHAIVARSTFRSQNVQNTPGSDHLLEVAMSKKCTPLWREAHFEVKTHKTHQVSDHFWQLRYQKCTPLWREAHFEVKMHKTLSRTLHYS